MLVIGILIIIRAGMRGLVREIFGFGSLLIGLLSAFIFSPWLAQFIVDRSSFQNTNLVSFIIIFVITYLILRLVGNVLSEWVDTNETLTGVDRVLGVGIGIVEVVIIAYAILVLLLIQPYIILTDVLESSITYNLLKPLLPFVLKLWNIDVYV